MSHLSAEKIASWPSLELPVRWPKEALNPPPRSIDLGWCLSRWNGAHHLSEAPSHDRSLSAWCRGVGWGELSRGNQLEFNSRAVKTSFQLCTPLPVPDPMVLSLNVAGEQYLVKRTFSLTQIPRPRLYQGTLQKRVELKIQPRHRAQPLPRESPSAAGLDA